jgi:predicted amidohydrolase
VEQAPVRKAKIGLMQVTGTDYSWSVEQCQEEMLYLAEQCLKDGADLVFMPEAYQYKEARNYYPLQELLLRYSADYLERCRGLARKYQAYVVPWDYEADSDGALYNTSFIFDRQGVEIGKYRKVLITQREEEAGITPGSSFPVFDLDFGKLGIMICFDNYFSEAARCLGLQGAELILLPLYGDTLKPQWEIMTKARAVDNCVYIATCQIHSVPVDREASFTGLVGPDGEVITKVTKEGSYSVVEIEPGKKVITQTEGPGSDQYEDIKEYLLHTRTLGVEAFQPILEPTRVLNWDEIAWKKR